MIQKLFDRIMWQCHTSFGFRILVARDHSWKDFFCAWYTTFFVENAQSMYTKMVAKRREKIPEVSKRFFVVGHCRHCFFSEYLAAQMQFFQALD